MQSLLEFCQKRLHLPASEASVMYHAGLVAVLNDGLEMWVKSKPKKINGWASLRKTYKNYTWQKATLLPPADDPDFQEPEEEEEVAVDVDTNKFKSSTCSVAEMMVELSEPQHLENLKRLSAFFLVNNPSLDIQCHVEAAKSISNVMLSAMEVKQHTVTQAGEVEISSYLSVITDHALDEVAKLFDPCAIDTFLDCETLNGRDDIREAFSQTMVGKEFKCALDLINSGRRLACLSAYYFLFILGRVGNMTHRKDTPTGPIMEQWIDPTMSKYIEAVFKDVSTAFQQCNGASPLTNLQSELGLTSQAFFRKS